MELDRRELKHQAREAMSLPRPPFWIVTLLYLLMTLGVNYLLSALPFPSNPVAMLGSVSFFLSVFFLLYKMVVDFGLNLWALWTYRHLNPGAGSLMQGFSITGRVLWMELLIFLRVLGWSIAISFLLIPLSLVLSAVVPSFLLVVVGGLYVAVWVILLRYSMAPYLLADHPDDGASAAIRRSVSLTQGWKWELFKLKFSFVGWLLLNTLISFLALLFCLWQGGFFQELAKIPIQQLPSLASGYLLWQSGISFDLLPISDQFVQLYNLFYSISNQLSTSLLSDVVSIPLLMWLIPYRLTTRAGFYCHRLRLQQEYAPPL